MASIIKIILTANSAMSKNKKKHLKIMMSYKHISKLN